MSRVLNEQEQAELLAEHNLLVKLQIKHKLLIDTVRDNHKPSLIHRIFNKHCKLCRLMKMVE